MLEYYKRLDVGNYTSAVEISNIGDVVRDRLEETNEKIDKIDKKILQKIVETNKKIDKVNKKILEVQKSIPNYKIGDKLITKRLRIITIVKIDYKKKLGYLYGAKINFCSDNDIIWFKESEILEPFTTNIDYEYKLVHRVLELEHEIELMKRV